MVGLARALVNGHIGVLHVLQMTIYVKNGWLDVQIR